MIARVEVDASDEGLGRYLVEVEYPTRDPEDGEVPHNVKRILSKAYVTEAVAGMAAIWKWDGN